LRSFIVKSIVVPKIAIAELVINQRFEVLLIKLFAFAKFKIQHAIPLAYWALLATQRIFHYTNRFALRTKKANFYVSAKAIAAGFTNKQIWWAGVEVTHYDVSFSYLHFGKLNFLSVVEPWKIFLIQTTNATQKPSIRSVPFNGQVPQSMLCAALPNSTSQ